MTLAVPPLLAAFPDAILAFDPLDRIVAWNPAAERLYLMPGEQAVGQSVWLLVPRKKSRPWARAVEAVRTAGHWAGELVTLAANGAVRAVDARWAVADDGVIVAAHSDAGDRRQQDSLARRGERWAAVRAVAGAAADALPPAAGPARDLLARAGHGADPVANGAIYHGAGAWVLVAAADPLARELARALLDAAGYTVAAAADPAEAGRQAAALRDRLRAAAVGFGPDTPAVTRELHRYRPLLPVVPADGPLDPAALLREVAEAVGRDQAFDPDSEVV